MPITKAQAKELKRLHADAIDAAETAERESSDTFRRNAVGREYKAAEAAFKKFVESIIQK